MENTSLEKLTIQINVENNEVAIIQDETSAGFLLHRTDQGQIDWDKYDFVIVAFSGGKDSLACLLHIIEQGCPKEKIELWHHDIDGQGKGFMDWKCTPGYCRGVAKALGVKIFFSYKVGGFEGELFRENAPTQAISFETPDNGLITVGGDSLKLGTRLVFPQMMADLSVRWCSAYLKIDVAARALTNQDRFKGKCTLFITGERAEESKGRAGYAEEEPHRTSKPDKRIKRKVDQWRPVHKWSTSEVWAIIARHKVKSHPCYRMGWGRCSCAGCIFGNANQWASLKQVDAELFNKIGFLEQLFGKTIDRKKSVDQKAACGKAYEGAFDEAIVAESKDCNWDLNNSVVEDTWTQPSGMFSEIDGPC